MSFLCNSGGLDPYRDSQSLPERAQGRQARVAHELVGVLLGVAGARHDALHPESGQAAARLPGIGAARRLGRWGRRRGQAPRFEGRGRLAVRQGRVPGAQSGPRMRAAAPSSPVHRLAALRPSAGCPCTRSTCCPPSRPSSSLSVRSGACRARPRTSPPTSDARSRRLSASTRALRMSGSSSRS